ncbi:MAG: hypothetical protein JSU66_12650 [Deltaproteobacteria bacterium]|nr:MAG: hypothetical protein JSU66_12650 [Deltaproteobacteria bacterium]
MRCHGCGASFDVPAGERVGFRDACEGCGADLHVCLNCAYHDPSAYNECREPNAERVSDRDRANRCDYFAPGPGSAGSGKPSAGDAKSALEALFKKD